MLTCLLLPCGSLVPAALWEQLLIEGLGEMDCMCKKQILLKSRNVREVE